MTDSLDRHVIGVVWVHPSLVQRPLPGDPHHWGKTEDPRDVEKLVNYFNDVGADSVRLRAAEFQVWGRITREALKQLTASLQVSESALRETIINGKHLYLRDDVSIQCFSNGHLLDVAATWSINECWPVRLHCFDLGLKPAPEIALLPCSSENCARKTAEVRQNSARPMQQQPSPRLCYVINHASTLLRS
ncbi:hypothetical protein VDGL01_12235 [Verticillium dahliae]